MLKDIVATCPNCGQETTLAISAPDPGVAADQRFATTVCRKCFAKIVAITEPDGTVHLGRYGKDGEKVDSFTAESTIDDAFGFSDILHIPFSLWQPRGEEIEEFQHRPEWAKALHDALADAQNKPRPLSVPRRIFISYKWGNEEEDAWVEMLSLELEARGNHVVFDRKVMREQQPPSVPELVARIAECHVFLTVLDPGYIARVSAGDSRRDEGWVTDEYHTALAFAGSGIVTLLGMLRVGDRLPAGFREFAHGKAGNTFDVREQGDLLPILDRFFVQFGSAPAEASAVKAALLLHDSRQAYEADDVQGALEQANAACRIIPDLADGFAQRTRVLYRTGQPEAALADAHRALKIDPTLDEMLIFGAASACDLKKWQEAASLGRLALERNRSQRNAHFLVGQALNELDQVEAALAHFEIARRSNFALPSLFENAGWAFRRAGDPAKGLDWYKQGLKIAPNDACLLANATAAAMEVGEAMQAYRFLELLSRFHPEFPDIPFLATTLASWCQENGSPPVLTKRIKLPAVVGTVECSDCDVHLSLENESKVLCGGCGAVLPPSIDPCSCCGSAGKVMLGMIKNDFSAKVSCPFCAKGTLEYTPH